MSAGQPHHRSILIVENDPDLQWRLARMLTVHGNRVVGTSSAEGALALVEQWPVDLVLIAGRLPGASRGVDFARELLGRYPALPLIIMAEAHPDANVLQRLQGAVEVLVKPFRFEALRSLIDSMPWIPAQAVPAE